jgi:hypothetical protein
MWNQMLAQPLSILLSYLLLPLISCSCAGHLSAGTISARVRSIPTPLQVQELTSACPAISSGNSII